MNLKTYRYSGPPSSVSLNVDGQVLDVILSPNRPVQLPPEHDYTRVMIAQDWLIEVEEAAPTAADASPASAAVPVPPATDPAAASAAPEDAAQQKTDAPARGASTKGKINAG